MAGNGPTPVKQLFAALRHEDPEIEINRIRVKYPADDDNVWFIRLRSSVEVQIDTHPGGQSPFLIESDPEGQRLETSDLQHAVAVILAWLAPP